MKYTCVFVLTLFILLLVIAMTFDGFIKKSCIFENDNTIMSYDTLEKHALIVEKFDNKLFIKSPSNTKYLYGLVESRVINGNRDKWQPFISPLISKHYEKIPDTIYATGYLVVYPLDKYIIKKFSDIPPIIKPPYNIRIFKYEITNSLNTPHKPSTTL